MPNFCGIPLSPADPWGAANDILKSCTDSPTTFRFVNAGTLAAAQGEPGYVELLKSDGTNYCDGAPLAAYMRRFAGRQFRQARGMEVFAATFEAGIPRRTRHFFLGTTDETLSRLVDEVCRRWPGVQIVGTYAPPFGPSSDCAVAIQDESIARAQPDVVWVALGTPKQDREAARIMRAVQVTTVAVGAAFDFMAGVKSEAPPVLRRFYLEWAFRMASEPRRLWRRYLIGNAVFLAMMARDLRGRFRA